MPLPDEESASDGPDAATDGSLLRRVRAGEQDAATELYHRYADRLQRLATRNTGTDLAVRFDSEDVVQSVFRTFFRRVQDGLYNLPEGDELWRLLLVLALNKIRKLAVHHRAQKRDVSATVHPDPTALDQFAGTSAGDFANQALRSTISELLANLPESHHAIVLLRIDGWQIDEIAARTGRSRRTVERVMQGFRERLQGQIDEASRDD